MFFRVHTEETAWATGKPRGLFVAVWKLLELGRLAEDEVEAYWKNRTWFESNLPNPPFYASGNPEKAVTWFKDTELGREMYGKMQFYREMTVKYGVQLFMTTCDRAPGRVIYEDDYQIGVIESQHEGEGFNTVALV